MIKNQNGLTLIEVLASLALLSVIGLVLWNVFFQGLSYSKKAVSQTAMQQEANMISMELTRIHQSHSTYRLVNTDCSIEIYDSESSPQPFDTFSHSELCISGITEEIDSSNSRDLVLTLHDKEHPENKFELTTTLYKLKGSSNNEN
ncbi:prepilin-type N-terminal cleavage/methylation domain-containing protein [Rossellomorea oryzaecorticis]|uniref:Prepilin-type N-terminal cleavage/methylation domain-containing protein n=1 Tax=Rossellomorea oryzaecorticis TaxID=1396505 RepID=A0ABU9K6L3_9BACI